MADVDHPKTHVEDQVEKGEVDLPRTQPISPKHEGIDPLTESDTMYPREETRSDSEKTTRKDNASEFDDHGAAQLTEDQTNARANDAQPTDVAEESRENLAEADKADDAEASPNADGKLPKDSQKANHRSSDKQNTSRSNKPATQDAGTETNDPKPARGDTTSKR